MWGFMYFVLCVSAYESHKINQVFAKFARELPMHILYPKSNNAWNLSLIQIIFKLDHFYSKSKKSKTIIKINEIEQYNKSVKIFSFLPPKKNSINFICRSLLKILHEQLFKLKWKRKLICNFIQKD
jgi:hypothetical protein